MRPLLLLFAALTLSACASGPAILKATMPLEILRDDGQPPRLGEPRLKVGGYRGEAPFSLGIGFDSDGSTLGKPTSVTWSMYFDGYCRDTGSVLRSVLIGPSGQIWRVRQVFVPPGPDRQQYWSSGGFGNGYGGSDTQALLDAAAIGGRFTLALEDEHGQLWNSQVFDTLDPAERQRQFAANVAEFEKADPTTVPVKSDMLIVTESPPFAAPWPPRACPLTPAARR